MSSGPEGYREKGGFDLQPEPELGEPEKEFLASIFGEAIAAVGTKSDEKTSRKISLDTRALVSMLSSAGYPLTDACTVAALVQRWISDEGGIWQTNPDPGGLATSFTVGRHPSPNTRATTELVQHWMQNHVPTVQIEEISVLASAVIGDRDKATKWLSQSNPATDNRPPIDLIGERDGYDRVKNLLLRIEYGALA